MMRRGRSIDLATPRQERQNVVEKEKTTSSKWLTCPTLSFPRESCGHCWWVGRENLSSSIVERMNHRVLMTMDKAIK